MELAIAILMTAGTIAMIICTDGRTWLHKRKVEKQYREYKKSIKR